MKHRTARVLLVTYNFPPGGGVGVQRPLAICTGLHKLGHEVSVLTAARPVTHVYDAGLLGKVPGKVAVFRAFNPEVPYAWRGLAKRFAGLRAGQAAAPSVANPGRSPVRRMVEWLAFPDPQKTWVPFAIRKAARIIQERCIDTVIVTVPPFSGLRIGIELKKRFPAIRLILDFRDEWIAYTLAVHRGGVGTEALAEAVSTERSAVAAADFTITVTESWLSQIRERSPEQPREKFFCVPNGFDPVDFPARAARRKPAGKFVFCHAGTIDSTPVYSARRLFEAIAGLPQAVRDRMAICLAGRIERPEAEFMDTAGVEVRRLGFLPHSLALEMVAQADCALLLVNARNAHSGKVFEYMALGKPILALSAPGGEIDRLLSATGAGRCVDGLDVEAIRNAVGSLVMPDLRGSGTWPRPDVEAIRAYERPRLIAEMAARTGIGLPGPRAFGESAPVQDRKS